MKNFIVAILSLLISFSSIADPVIYTFSGTVTGIYGTGPSRTNLHLDFGSPVTFVVLVDASGAGYSVSNTGQYTFSQDTKDTKTYFAQLLSRSYFVNESYYHWDRVNFVGVNDFCTCFPQGPISRLFVGLELFYIDAPYPLSSWGAGQQLGAIHSWHDSVTQDYISVFFNLTVSDIQMLPAIFSGGSMSMGMTKTTPAK